MRPINNHSQCHFAQVMYCYRIIDQMRNNRQNTSIKLGVKRVNNITRISYKIFPKQIVMARAVKKKGRPKFLTLHDLCTSPFSYYSN